MTTTLQITNPRLSRMFASDGKCLDIAVDHGTFGTHSFLKGIEDIRLTISTLVTAAPDAIQLSPGQAPQLQNRPGKKPALVMRMDAGNFYGPDRSDYLFSQVIDAGFNRAIQLDAACIVVNLLALPGKPELFQQSVQNVVAVRKFCDETGMPLMVEPLAMKPEDTGYGVDGTIETIVTLVRQAVELGADVVKADPSDETSEYGRALESASGRPLLARGGGKAETLAMLQRTRELMDTGISGLVYGRNVLQHADPVGVARALSALVHSDASAIEAAALIAGDGNDN